MTDAPFLSVVLTGRNDDHGVNFPQRFLRALRFNTERLAERRIDHEFVFVEWAPLADRPWLRNLVEGAFPDVLPRCQWWLVDPRYGQRAVLNLRLNYPEFYAKNVGLRRALGRLVLTSNCDVYLGREVVNRLARQDLSAGTLYRAVRHDLAPHVDQEAVDWSLLEDPQHYIRQGRPLRPPLYFGSTGDFLLLDRESLHALRGFNEVYSVVKLGVDRNFLVHAHAHKIPIEDIGGAIYHSYHADSYRETSRAFKGVEDRAPYGKHRWGAGRLTYDNPSSWGLGLAPVREVADRVWWVDFDWRAVAPLAALHRLGVEAS